MTVRHDRKVSILDVMGPVMVGPSSSHTAGTARLGRVAREILDEDPVSVRFYLHPPLAATYRGHGSDFALVGGAIGLNVDDPRIPEAIRIAEQMGVDIEFHDEDLGEVHPNTARVEIEGVLRAFEAARLDMFARTGPASLSLPDAAIDVVIHETTQELIASTGQPWWTAERLSLARA